MVTSWTIIKSKEMPGLYSAARVETYGPGKMTKVIELAEPEFLEMALDRVREVMYAACRGMKMEPIIRDKS